MEACAIGEDSREPLRISSVSSLRSPDKEGQGDPPQPMQEITLLSSPVLPSSLPTLTRHPPGSLSSLLGSKFRILALPRL